MSQIGAITNKVLSSHKDIIESASKALGNDTHPGKFGARMEKFAKPQLACWTRVELAYLAVSLPNLQL